MIMKANKQIGFIYKNEESIDKILKDGDVVFERGFLREKTSTTLPITFGGVGKNLKDYKVYGNTYQNSTSGKNLLETTLYNRVQQGITTTYDSEDGALILNGTATSTYSNLTEVSPLNLQPGKYIFSLKEIKPYSVQLRMTYEDNTVYSRTIPNNTKSIEVNITKTTKNQRVFIFENSTMSGTTFTNERLYVQLEEGSTATEFEPYTGGQPSPNPDYPQEMVSCGDRTKNLFDKNINYVSGNLQDNGNVSTNTNYITYDYINISDLGLKIGDEFTYSILNVYETSNTSRRLLLYANSNEVIGAYTFSPSTFETLSQTITIPNNTTKIRISARITDKDIQIEKGNTATPYEPYGYKIPINVRSDNLCDGINKKYWLSTTVLSAGMADGNSGLAIELKENTNYTISTQIIQERYRVALINTLPTSGTGIPCYNGVKKDGTKDNITISSSQYKYLILNATDLTKCQIVEGSTAPTKYIPYYNETTNIYLDEPLRKIGDYSDYIDFINSKVVKNIGSKVYNGSENGWYISGKSAKIRLSDAGLINISNLYNYSESLGNVAFCNYFKQEIPQTLYTAGSLRVDIGFGIAVNPSTSSGLFFANNISSLNDFKEWLSSNPVTVNYLLATPTEEDIELPNIPTIDGNNTLNIETEITPSQVYIKYKSNE